jgi:hypothetical protein
MLEDKDEVFPRVRVNGRGEVVRKPNKEEPAPEPDDAVVEVVHIGDLIQRNGRSHKAVRATWKHPRQLTATELMILSYFREHKILLDGNDECVGFEAAWLTTTITPWSVRS